jgi:diaminopimelate epimerase
MTPFLKMHGLGNDFAVFDARKQALALNADLARSIADRRRGVGCDQIIVIEKAAGADAFMRIHNADGAEVETCGNATRCVARLLMQETDRNAVSIATPAGVLTCADAGSGFVTVDMGLPRFAWNEIPLACEIDTNHFSIEVGGKSYTAAATSMGNPHCVLFVDDAEAAPVATLGPRIESHPLFPKKTNVEFVTVRDRSHLRMRVWERGAGITLACGSGSCAVVAAAHRRGLIDRTAEVELDGGVLAIEIRETDGHVLMTGQATLAYRGEIDLGALGA